MLLLLLLRPRLLLRSLPRRGRPSSWYADSRKSDFRERLIRAGLEWDGFCGLATEASSHQTECSSPGQ